MYCCPQCSKSMKPIYKDVVRLSGELMQYEGEPPKLVRATPKEWLCRDCEKIWKIEEVGVLC